MDARPRAALGSTYLSRGGPVGLACGAAHGWACGCPGQAVRRRGRPPRALRVLGGARTPRVHPRALGAQLARRRPAPSSTRAAISRSTSRTPRAMSSRYGTTSGRRCLVEGGAGSSQGWCSCQVVMPTSRRRPPLPCHGSSEPRLIAIGLPPAAGDRADQLHAAGAVRSDARRRRPGRMLAGHVGRPPPCVVGHRSSGCALLWGVSWSPSALEALGIRKVSFRGG